MRTAYDAALSDVELGDGPASPCWLKRRREIGSVNLRPPAIAVLACAPRVAHDAALHPSCCLTEQKRKDIAAIADSYRIPGPAACDSIFFCVINGMKPPEGRAPPARRPSSRRCCAHGGNIGIFPRPTASSRLSIFKPVRGYTLSSRRSEIGPLFRRRRNDCQTANRTARCAGGKASVCGGSKRFPGNHNGLVPARSPSPIRAKYCLDRCTTLAAHSHICTPRMLRPGRD